MMIGPKLSGALPTDKPPFNRIFLGKAFMSIKLIKLIKKESGGGKKYFQVKRALKDYHRCTPIKER
jgi:hypothetical protein